MGQHRRKMGAAALLLAAGACATPGGAGREAAAVVNVHAGARERLSTPVTFELPAGMGNGAYHLRGADGQAVPLQVDDAGRGHFILDALAQGAVATFTLLPGEAPVSPVALRRDGAAVAFEVDGKPVLRYNSEVTPLPRPDIPPIYARGGYIHPIHTPGGVLVTGDYPPDHIHHHGVWASWTRTRFEGADVDFWNVADRKGDVVPMGLDSAWSGSVFGGFSARHRYVALTGAAPKDALHERWTGRIFNVRGNVSQYWLFDLEIEQNPASESPLVLPQYHYGGVAFRGREDWYGVGKAYFLTSEGRDRSNGNETRARWTHVGGLVDGELGGVAVLSHPENFRHPEPVRIHPNEPYFVWTPSQLGEWSIEPGRTHRARYRYVVHDGAPDAADLERIWYDFANPPIVMVAPR